MLYYVKAKFGIIHNGKLVTKFWVLFSNFSLAAYRYKIEQIDIRE